MVAPAYRGAPPSKPTANLQLKGLQSYSSLSSRRFRLDRSPTRRIVAAANLVLGVPRRGDISSQLQNQLETSSPRTRLFNVCYTRHAEIIQNSLSTKDDAARLRRFRHVLQEHAICQNERFQPHLDYMRSQHGVLATKADAAEDRRRATVRLEMERHAAMREDYETFLLHLEQKTAKLAAMRLQAKIRGSLARSRVRKMKALCKMLAPPQQADVLNSKGEVDLRHKLIWNSRFVWACEIEQRAGERAKHFVFLADITPREVKEKRGGRCVFESVMYDIQEFVPVGFDDGKVEFELRFGINTAERQDVPSGWCITFCVKPGDAGTFAGMLESSFWGNRSVTLRPLNSLDASELGQFPDLVGRYYKSRPT